MYQAKNYFAVYLNSLMLRFLYICIFLKQMQVWMISN